MGTTISTADIRDKAVTSQKLERDINIVGNLTINGFNGSDINPQYDPTIFIRETNDYLSIRDTANEPKPIAISSLIVGENYEMGWIEVPTKNIDGNLTKNGSAFFAGDVVIGGNLTIRGTSTHINAETVDIADNIVLLNSNVESTSTPTEDAGIEINRGNSNNRLLIWDETNDYFKIAERNSSNGSIINSSRIIDQTYGDGRYARLAGANFTGNVGIGIAQPEGRFHIFSVSPTMFITASETNQVESGRIRFTEATGSWQGAFIHYDGSTNRFNIGVHDANDTLASSDINAISIARATGDITLVGNITMASGKTVDGVDISAHHANSIADVKHVTDAYLAALAGTNGTPSGSNRYVTNSDPRLSDSRTPVKHGDSLHDPLSYFDIITDGTNSRSATSSKQNVKFAGTSNIKVTVSSDSSHDAIVTIDDNHNHDGVYVKLTPSAPQTITQNTTFANDVVISGNLTVSGTTTYVNTANLNVGDNIITLNADLTDNPIDNAGIEVNRGTKNDVSLLWDESNKYWQISTPNASDVISFSRIIDKAYGDTIYMPINKNTFTKLYVGDGTAYGDVPFVIGNSANYNDSTFVTVKRDGSTNPAFSIFPSDADVGLSIGAYYSNGGWVHNSNSANSQLLIFVPGTGVKWSASNNSSASWNISSERLLWDSTGYWCQPIRISSTTSSYITGGALFGLGKTSPTCQLDVESSTYPPIRSTITSTLSNSSLGALELVHKTTSASTADNFGVAVTFASDVGGAKNNLGHIKAIRTGADNRGTLVFETNHNGTAYERMRISSDGNVGIGNTSPKHLLSVGTSVDYIADSAIAVGGTNTSLILANTKQNYGRLLYSNSDKTIRINIYNAASTQEQTALIADENGKVGIGTTSSLSSRLTVADLIKNEQRSAVSINATAQRENTTATSMIAHEVNMTSQIVGAGINSAGENIGIFDNVLAGQSFAGTLAAQKGLQIKAGIGASATEGSKITNVYGSMIQIHNDSPGTIIDNAYCLYLNSTPTSGTIQNNYSIYSVNGKNYFGGSIQVGGQSSSYSGANKFAVHGDATGSSSYYSNGIVLKALQNESQTGISLESPLTGSSRWIAGLNNADRFDIGRGSEFTTENTYFSIISGGNVGIGTINPTEKLDVNGSVASNGFIAKQSNGLKVQAGNGYKSMYVDNYNYISIKSHNNDVWMRSVNGTFAFQTYDDADDTSRAFHMHFPDPGTPNGDNLVAEIGQRRSGSTTGSYKGIRIVHYKDGSIQDGYLQAGDGVFTASLKVGSNNVWHSGNFNPSTKLDATADKYLSNVFGTVGGTITFTIANGTNITWNSAHTHPAQNAITKVTAINRAGVTVGTYTASTSQGEVKLKAGNGINMTVDEDTITFTADASASNVPKSKVFKLNAANNYTGTFTHYYGTMDYVVLLGVDSPQRHVYYSKDANSVQIFLDDVPYDESEVEVSVMVQLTTD